MFRVTLTPLVWATRSVQLPVARTLLSRSIHCTPVLMAKAKKSKKDTKKDAKKDLKELAQDEVSASDIIDMAQAKAKFEAVVEKFNKKAAEVKLGKTNPNLFDNLDIKTSDGPVKFTSIAQTAIKGRNMIITVFDPDQAKNIVSSILDSNLNMNPTYDASQGVLKVPLPPVTSESKNEQVKVLKQIFERFKTGPNSLNSIRSDYKQKFNKINKKTDSDKKIFKDFEGLHKEYLDKLGEKYKTVEKMITK